MRDNRTMTTTSRRGFLYGLAATGLSVAVLPFGSLRAAAKGDLAAEAMKAVLGDAKPTAGRVTVELPEIAENGNTVPCTVKVDSPMTAADHVKQVTVFATGNPTPNVCTLNFTPESGKAEAAIRIRLGKTQDIVVIAQMSDGKFYSGKKNVKVTIGGCGG